MTEPAPRKRRVFKTEDRWTKPGDLAFQIMWFEFLRFSPSYELARKHRAGTLSANDTAQLPADFEAVLSVYDDLGDLQAVDFETWWPQTGIRFLGNEGRMLTVAPIGVLSADYADPLNVVANRANEFIEGTWLRQGKPTTAIMSVPLGLTKTQIIEQLGFLLDRFDRGLKNAPPLRAKYPIQEGKNDLNSLFGYMRCLAIKASAPEATLHDIGALADISSTYSARIGFDDDADDRNALRILTSRALDRGLMIAENAARGIFPSYAHSENAVSPNWSELGARLDAITDGLNAKAPHS